MKQLSLVIIPTALTDTFVMNDLMLKANRSVWFYPCCSLSSFWKQKIHICGRRLGRAEERK